MKKIFFLLVLFFMAQKITACSCNYQGSFLKLAPKTTLIALVKIKEWTNYTSAADRKNFAMAMKVKIIATYQGKSGTKIIEVWGDNGAQCRPYISNFTVGQYYVIAFSRIGNTPEGNYYINNCGCYWLKADKKSKTVTGDISSNNQTSSTLSFKELAQKLRSAK